MRTCTNSPGSHFFCVGFYEALAPEAAELAFTFYQHNIRLELPFKSGSDKRDSWYSFFVNSSKQII